MTTTIGDRLAALKRRSNLSMSEIARLAGYKGPSSIQRYFAPDYDPSVLDYRFALKLVDAMQGAGDPPIDIYEIMQLTDRGAIEDPSVGAPRQPQLDKNEFIAVYGTAPIWREYTHANRGDYKAEAIEIDRSEPIEYFEVPPFLARRDVYAFIHSGTSLEPRLEDGEIAFTEGRRQPSIGDYVLLIVEERREFAKAVALVGRLESRNADMIQISQPSGAKISIPFEDVSTMRRIMRAHELLISREPA